MPDGPAKEAAFQAAHMGGTQRAFLGRGVDKASQLVLRDEHGKKRLVLRVTAGGDPSIEFLDAAGKVVRTSSERPGIAASVVFQVKLREWSRHIASRKHPTFASSSSFYET